MTALKRSILLLAFLSAFALTAQQSKKPIPSTKTVDKASEVIDTVITTKDTVQPVKREETVTTTTTTTTTDENGNVTASDKNTTTNTSTTGTAAPDGPCCPDRSDPCSAQKRR
jgi:cytoskeletal protein RodZ